MNSLSELNRQEHPVRLRTHSQPRSHFPALAILLVAGVAIGCNSPVAPDNSIPDPALAALQLTGAALVVGGQVVNGQTMQAGQMQGTSTLFKATLRGANGAPALGHSAQVQYRTPGGGPGSMMNGQGLLHLYDDGTHGDPVAGDGIYCYEDGQGQYGFHMPWAPAGQYHYEFYGFDHDERHSNHMTAVVTMVSAPGAGGQ